MSIETASAFRKDGDTLMFRFANLSIRKKLAVGFGTLLAAMVLLGAFSLTEMAKLNGATEEITQKRMFEVSYLNTVRNDISTTRRTELMWLLVSSKEEIAENDASLASALQRLLQDVKEGQDRYLSVATEEERRLYQKFQDALQNCVGLHGQILALRQAGNEEGARKMAISQQPLIAAMFDAIDQVTAQSVKNADASAQQAAGEYQSVRTLALILLTLAIAAGIGLTIVVSNSIAKPLGLLVAGFRQGANGDLTTRIEVTSEDEVGQVSGAFNIFMEGLQSVMQQVASSSQQVASASEEIAASATQSANGALGQNDQVAQVATAMQEMSSTVVEVSNNSNQAAESARKASETAIRGGQIVNEALETMRSIANSVGTTARKIEELGNSSSQIGKIIAVIDDIADQTNLLALNAAIEAARAGEQGRGFAVVADEVRKLAERTTKATKEIAQMIDGVQKETSSAVGQMQSGNKQVEVGVATTAKAGDSLKEIITAAQQVGDMVSQIATAANQQTSTADQINANVEQIAKISRESSVSSQQSAKACEDLSNLALDLQQLVSRFKLNSDGEATRNDAICRPSRSIRACPPSVFSADRSKGHGAMRDYEMQAGNRVN
jgi:methyl-accepting chemotaxis protein